MMLLPPEDAVGADPSPEGVYVVVGAQHKAQDSHVAWWNDYPNNPLMASNRHTDSTLRLHPQSLGHSAIRLKRSGSGRADKAAPLCVCV